MTNKKIDKEKVFYLIILSLLFCYFIFLTSLLLNSPSSLNDKNNHLQFYYIKEYTFEKTNNIQITDFLNQTEKIIKLKNFKDYLSLIEVLTRNNKEIVKEIVTENEKKVLKIKNKTEQWYVNHDQKFPIEIDKSLLIELNFKVSGKKSGGITLVSTFGKNDYQWWKGLSEIYFGIDGEKKIDIQFKDNSPKCSLCQKIPLFKTETKDYHFFLYFPIDKNFFIIYDVNNLINFNNKQLIIKNTRFENKNKIYKVFWPEQTKFFKRNKIYFGVSVGSFTELYFKDIKIKIK